VMERNPNARQETWYYELPLPADLKKFSKGSRIQDQHFAEARQMWEAWRAYLNGEGQRSFHYAEDIRQCWQTFFDAEAENPDSDETRALRPAEPYTAWIETMDALSARNYDLSARNPHQDDRVKMPHPTEITASLIERTREFQSILLNLHEILGNGGDNE
jgi:type I restriction enzyme M protein